MRVGYGADYVRLHVRVSDGAAKKLYCEGMGYMVNDVIGMYYQDEEDAYLCARFWKRRRLGWRSRWW